MINVEPGVQVESLALQEVNVHPSMGSNEEASIQVTYYMEINGTVCGPCKMKIDTMHLPDEDRTTAIFLEYLESTVLTKLGGLVGRAEKITSADDVPKGIIKKGF